MSFLKYRATSDSRKGSYAVLGPQQELIFSAVLKTYEARGWKWNTYTILYENTLISQKPKYE